MKTLNASSHMYEDVGKQQVYLTESEEIDLVSRYSYNKQKLHKYILKREACLTYFINKYKQTKASGKSAAKLSADYNPRKAGLNQQIEQRMSMVLAPDKQLDGTTMAESLFALNIADSVYAEMMGCLVNTATLDKIQREIHDIEDILFRSLLMAGAEIAKKYASRLLGVDEEDATQEVNIYLLESVRKYDHTYRTDVGDRIKLCTYAYNRSEKLLKEWILTNSRLVRVPRSKMERILVVVRAYNEIVPHDINLPELVACSNKLLKERKGKLTSNSMFTIDEVDGLISVLLSTFIHLDFKQGNRSNQKTVGDMLVDDKASVIDAIEDEDKREQLLETLQDHLTDKEFQVIMLRYFYDSTDKVPKALKEVGGLLASVYGGTDYSRESIRLLEKSAIAKLQGVKEVRKLWEN